MKTVFPYIQFLRQAIIISIMSFLTFQASAQIINTISATPNPATSSQSININVEGQLINGCWSVNGVSYQRNGSIINVYVDFLFTSAPFCIQIVQNFNRTISLSPLPVGTYTLRAYRLGSNALLASNTLIVTAANGGGGGNGGGNTDCACSNPASDNICDDFESYSTASRLGPQSPCWTTGSGAEGGSEDGRLYLSAGNKYLRMQGQTGSSQNVVLQLGNRSSGVYELSFDVYNYSTSAAVYSLLSQYAPNNSQSNASIYCFGSGLGYIIGGGSFQTFNISTNQWNRFSHYIDLQKNLVRLYVNGEFIHEWAYQPQGGIERLGGLSFAASGSGYRYNVDNVSMTAYDAGCLDISQVRPNVYCTLEYVPVCGCDGREYSNGCAAQNAGLTSWTEGSCGSECIDPTLISNPVECPLNIDWVCGCDGNTYMNECLAISNGVTDWTDGPCGESCVDPNVVVGPQVYCPQVYDPVCGL